MVEKAETLGLEFDSAYLEYFLPCFNAVLRDSMSTMYRALGQHERPLGVFAADGEAVHQSALDRLGLAECAYGPKQLVDLSKAGTCKIVNTKRITRGTPCPPLP
jgi:hypothetical protein